jgi:hypothetical protein
MLKFAFFRTPPPPTFPLSVLFGNVSDVRALYTVLCSFLYRDQAYKCYRLEDEVFNAIGRSFFDTLSLVEETVPLRDGKGYGNGTGTQYKSPRIKN